MAKEEKDIVIELDEEDDGDMVDSDNFVFEKIGKSVPLKPNDSKFDLESPPAQPLAVSDRFQVIFVAHSEGFYVAKTKEVIDSAKEIKEKGSGSCIQELCIVNVPIGKVHILALSMDSSYLAASVGGEIHLYAVQSLLNKEQQASSTCSLHDASNVKDFRWRKKMVNTYAVLSKGGTLYHGDVDGSLKEVMDNVDAVDWSKNGNFIAVARKNTLSILSSKFRDRFHMLLLFKTLVCDSDPKHNIVVDSIQWVRRDCIILGCCQVTEDGDEENYFVQVISSRDGKISEDTSKPVVLSFSDVFTGIIDDIVPCGSGPHLFLSYLENWELLLAANRKNTDQHIVLLGWSVDEEQKDAAVIDLSQDDRWLPTVELQENGDDNVIMGFGVDQVSLYEKVKFKQGVEERELSPHCVLLCLTLEGKLIMFYLARVIETPVSPQFVDATSDEEVNSSAVVPSKSASKTQGPLLSFDARKVPEQSQKPGDDLQYNTNLVPKSSPFGSQSADVEKLSVNSSHLQGITKGETGVSTLQKVGLSTDSSTGSALTGAFTSSKSSNFKDSTRSADITKGFLRGTSSAALPSGPYSLSAADQVNARSSFSPSPIERNRNDSSGFRTGNTTCDNINNGLPTKDRSVFPVHSSANINQSGGQRTSVDAGKFESVPTIRSSQLSQGSSAPGKSFNFKLQPTQEASKVPSSPVLLASDPALSKHLGSVNDMARDLDNLLQSIEKEGGYRDNCTQKSSVLSLEQDLEKLSWKCREWRNTMEERLEEIQHLFDKTVQVLSRQIYIEGFVKQSSDSQYRDLLNRQKLSPELEQKRQRMLKVNQELTNQLIQLERHFNTLELDKFDKTTVGYSASRTILEPSRHSQSLYSLYNTVNSQLRAAEQLSECLSDQMTELKIESPVKKRQSKTKELLESIGLPYDVDSFNSPDVKRGGRSPDSIKKLSFSSHSFNSKEQFRSATKNVEPETARRRRDSLDRSWASFEPPKTTVKRLVLQEERHKVSATKSASVARKADQKQGSFFSQPSDKIDPSPSLFSPTSKDESKRYHANREMQSDPSKQLSGSPQSSFTRVDNYSGSAQSTLKFPFMRMTKNSPTPSSSAVAFPSLSSSNPAQTNTQGPFGLTSDRSSAGMFRIPKSESSEVQPNSFSKPVRQFQSETSHNQTPTSSFLQAQPVLAEKKSQNEENELSNSSSVGSTQTKTLMGTINQGTTTEKSSSAASMRSNSSPLKTAYAVPTSTPTFGKVPGNSTNKTDYGNLSAPAVPSTISSSLSVHPLATTISSVTTTSTSPFSSSTVSSQSSSSSISPSSPSSLFSSGYFSFDPPNKQLEQSPNEADSLNPKLMETKPPSGEIRLNSDLQAPPPNSEPPSELSLKSVVNDPSSHAPAPLLVLSPSGEFDLNSEAPVKPTPAEEVSVLSASGSESSSTTTASTSVFTGVSNASPESQLETPSPVEAQVQSTSPSTGATDGKNEKLDTAVTQEDEMDEEAPETMSDMGLGGLSSFGLGSAPTSAAPKPNLFGGAFGNNTQVKSNPFGGPFGNSTESNAGNPSPFTLTQPAGQLFRPASFSINTSQPAQPTNPAPFSGGAFTLGASAPQPAPSGFGQLAQVGAGQQALGSVLGSFGQSRQFGTGLPGNSFASGAPGGGTGFGAPSSIGGFANASTGGFAAAASGGGFAAAASGGGGFAAAASGGGGFAVASSGGGFAGAAGGGGFGTAATAGGGFGGFGNNQGGGAFAAFGSNKPASGAPQSNLFTQIRR
ncbi:hypothetical protein MKW98_008668 [Papaver atlanticum]|uniref:Nuclear pore complex protein n=1 Tax=Papaver atlanticum TaxID=357466 RepID=A0AAD4S5U9_9MAGN|nr:hypothetical protein MKW98_008668 [Papaver atlanticum]